MFALFRALTERVKALFITTVALDFEAELLARNAERKAELLRLAERYDQEGQLDIAQQLRQQAEKLSMQQPLASVLPAIEHFQDETVQEPPLLRLLPEPEEGATVRQPLLSTPKSPRRRKS